jgi:hypothetical protein
MKTCKPSLISIDAKNGLADIIIEGNPLTCVRSLTFNAKTDSIPHLILDLSILEFTLTSDGEITVDNVQIEFKLAQELYKALRSKFLYSPCNGKALVARLDLEVDNKNE